MSGTHSTGPLYPNQPLREVAVEIRFRGRLRVEQIRADFQDAIQEKYSLLYVPMAVPNMAPATQHFRFECPEESCGVLLAVNSISVYARDYPGFDAFFGEANRLLTIALGMVGNVALTRVGWRYINAIPFPRENGTLPFGKIFQHTPWLASALDGEWGAFAVTARMPFSGVSANLRLAAGADEKMTQTETLVFDIDAYSEFDPPEENSGADRCAEEIRRMHDAAREIFERSINDDYRQFLLGDDE